MERQADPEAVRARRESSRVDSCKPAAAVAAIVRAAKAEAEEAIPVPVGKLLLLITLANCFNPAILRTRSSSTLTRCKAGPVIS